MAKIKPSNFRIIGNLSSSVAIGCEDQDGNRYHIWVTTDAQPQPADQLLFKNPPTNTRKFKTISLAHDGAIGRQLVPLLLAKAAELMPEHLAANEAAKARQEAERIEAARLYRIKEAGPELLDMLKSITAQFKRLAETYEPDSNVNEWLGHANEVITKAEGK